ncbi:MAG: methyltransferase [Actinomycetota bacterium]
MSTLGSFGRFLKAAGYLEQTVAEALAISAGTVPAAPEFERLRKRLAARPPGRLGDLISLLLLGTPMEPERIDSAVNPFDSSSLVAMGLLRPAGGRLKATVTLSPYLGLIVAHDLSGAGMNSDHVLGPSPSGRTLTKLTPHSPVGRTLDLGTGCGMQALLASHHSRSVVAADIVPRALEVTRLNAALNEVTNVELAHGSLFEPVTGRFDLILANIPFVVSPGAEYAFRDGGLGADAMSKQVASAVPDFLEKDGIAVVLVNWVRRSDEPCWAAPAEWSGGRGCDVLIVHYGTLDAAGYAAGFNAFLPEPQRQASIERWLAYYRAEGVRSIGLGALIMRRATRDAGNWVRPVNLAHTPTLNSGKQIERIFRARPGESKGPFLDGVFSVVKGHRLVNDTLVLDEGLGIDNHLEASTLAALRKLDGRTRLRDLLADGEPGVAQGVVDSIIQLYELGLLNRLA